jgi:hypothetical protein
MACWVLVLECWSLRQIALEELKSEEEGLDVNAISLVVGLESSCWMLISLDFLEVI